MIATSISAVESTFKSLFFGNNGMILESTISPAPDLAKLEDLSNEADASLVAPTVVLKLKGGPGTGMDLDKPNH